MFNEPQAPQIDEGRVEATVSLAHVLRVLRRQAWVVALCAIVAAGAAVAYSRTRPKEYTATASLVFNNQNLAAQAAGQAAVANTDPQGQRETNLQLVELSNAASQRTAASIGLGITASEIRDAVSATAQGDSNVISIAATSRTPELAARIANTFTHDFIAEQRRNQQSQIQAGIDLVQQQYSAIPRSEQGTEQAQSLLDHIESLKILKSLQNNTQLVQGASIPSSPSSPRIARNGVFGLVIGLIVGLLFALIRERRDRRLREPQDVADSFGLPMLGVIPHASESSGGEPGAILELEPFRLLRAHLRYFNVDRELRTLMVVSARPAEGKTTVARYLATAAATTGTKTILIEADLRRPTLGLRLGLSASAGIAEALVGATSIEQAIQRLDVTHSASDHEIVHALDVITAGSLPPNPAELLESQAMTNLLTWARAQYEFVVIDTAPLSVVADAIPLMSEVDGIIVVSRLGFSTRDVSDRLRDQLEHLQAPVLGVVINDAKAGPRGYQDYGYDKTGTRYTAKPNRATLAPAEPRTDLANGAGTDVGSDSSERLSMRAATTPSATNFYATLGDGASNGQATAANETDAASWDGAIKQSPASTRTPNWGPRQDPTLGLVARRIAERVTRATRSRLDSSSGPPTGGNGNPPQGRK